jgi:hypothetical protein
MNVVVQLPRNPVSEEPPRSTLLNVARTIEGEDWSEHGVVMANMPTGHVNIGSELAIASPGLAPTEIDLCLSQRFPAFTLDKRVGLKGLGGDTEKGIATADILARHMLEAGTAYGVSRALQFGVNLGAYGVVPGLSALPVGTGAGQVPFITSSGVVGAFGGSPVSLTQGIAVALDWWVNYGLDGQCVLHLPAQMAPYAGMGRLIEPGQQGAALLAGGLGWLSFGPGYDTRVGPGGQVAPAGSTWIWITSEVHVGLTGITTSAVRKDFRGESFVKAERHAVLAYNTPTVAAVLVTVP